MNEERYNLYVGNLHSSVTEHLLRDIFAATGANVGQVKIISDKSQGGGLNYGFVELFDKKQAEIALNSLDKREIIGVEVKVNWANGGTGKKEDTSNHYHIFVGDLSSDVNDAILLKAFAAFGSVSEARVMWDQNTGKSRGYGFVAFRDKVDADQAIAQMSGQWLGNRAIRCNWANQKNMETASNSSSSNQSPDVIAQSSPNNTTVYIGNLTPETTQAQLSSYFQQFGAITEVRIQNDKGYGFVKYDNHDSATSAIYSMNGKSINGKSIKCSWGKDRNAASATTVATPVVAPIVNYGTAPMVVPSVSTYPAMYPYPYQVPPNQHSYPYDYTSYYDHYQYYPNPQYPHQ